MSTAIERMKGHFAAIGRQRLELPELAGGDGKPLVLTWLPMTVADASAVTKRGTMQPGDPGTAVAVIIRKAQDEDGKPLFGEEDRHALLHQVDRALIDRIAGAIIGGRADEAGDLAAELAGVGAGLAELSAED